MVETTTEDLRLIARVRFFAWIARWALDRRAIGSAASSPRASASR